MINERKLVVVSGPSGCGKDTIVSRLKQQRSDIRQSVSCTTRAPREGEQHGVNYYYISREEFLQRLENGFSFNNAGRFLFDCADFSGFDRTFSVNRLTKCIHYTSEHCVTYGNLYNSAGGLYDITLVDILGITE